MMETNFNLGSLKIVHTPLMDYFKKIQSNVSENLVLIRDEKKIATNYESLEVLNKVQGTLKMIGLVGLVKVLQLTKDALKDVKDIKYDTNKSVQVLELCESIYKNIAIYIQNLLNGEMDQPTKFYEEYSKLASLIGKNVSIKDLFIPRLEFKTDTPAALQNEVKVGLFINDVNKSNILNTINQNRSFVSASVQPILLQLNTANPFSSIEQKNNYHTLCKEVFEGLDKVQKLKLSKTVYILLGLQKLLVCVSSPIFNDKVDYVLANHLDNLQLAFVKLDENLTHLYNTVQEMEDGEKTSSIKADDDTVRETLYVLISILKSNNQLNDMPIVKELNSYFDIEFYENQLNDTGISASILQKNPEIAGQIDKSLIEIKEELTLITSKQTNSPDFLNQHVGKFIALVSKLNDSLNSVEREEMKSILGSLVSIMSRVKSNNIIFTESLQKEISLAVVLIEYGISHFVKSIVDQNDSLAFSSETQLQQQRLALAADSRDSELALLALPVLDDKSKKNDERKAFLKIFTELSKELKKSEEILDQYFRTKGENIDEMDAVFKPLNSARGIFAVVGQGKLSEIVSDISKVWKTVVATGLESVDKELLSQSVSWLSGISLYVAAAENDNDTEAQEVADNLTKKYNRYHGHEEVIALVSEVSEPKAVIEEFVPVVDDMLVLPSVEETENISSYALYDDFTNDEDLLEVYLMEADEVLENAALSFKVLDTHRENTEEITNLRRYYHTLKGSGRMVGLNYLGEAAWMVEQTLNRVLSGDIAFNDELFSAISQSKADFESWVTTLKQEKKVSVDLVKIKAQFKALNDHLTNTVDIADAPVTQEVIEVPVVTHDIIEEPVALEEVTPLEVTEEAETEVVRDSINIDGQEVSTTLYQLFNDESIVHVNEMKSYVENEAYSQRVEITPDFMRHAHTLSSIARTVNLKKFAQVASKIEFISNLAIEKNAVLSQEEFAVLKSSVEHLEYFKQVSHTDETNDAFNDIMNSLSLLQNQLNESVVKENVQSEMDYEAFREKIINDIKEGLHNDVDNINNAMDEIKEELHNLKNREESKIDIQALEESILKKLEENTQNNEEVDVEHINKTMSEIKEELHNLKNREETKVDVEAIETSILKKLEENNQHNEDIVSQTIDVLKLEEDLLKRLKDEANTHSKEHVVIQEPVDTNKIYNDLEELFSRKFEELNESMRVKEEQHQQVVAELNQKIELLNKDLNVLTENQDELVKTQSTALEDFRKQIIGFAHLLKKKSNGNYNELFSQEELTQEEIEEITNELNLAYEESLVVVQQLSREGVSFDTIVTTSSPVIELFIEKSSVQKPDTYFEEVAPIVSSPENVAQANEEKEVASAEELLIEDLKPIDLPVEIIEENYKSVEKEKSLAELTYEVAVDTEKNVTPINIPNISQSVETIVVPRVTQNSEMSEFLDNNDFIKAIFEEKISSIEDEIDPELYEISKIEADEMLEKIEEITDAINSNQFIISQNQELKRHLHTFKGSVRMAGANKLGAVAHRLESLLDYSENHHISLLSFKPLLDKEMDKVHFLMNNPGELSRDKLNWLDSLVENTVEETHEVQEIQNAIVTQPLIKKEERQYIRVSSNLVDGLINEAGEIRLTRTTLEGMVGGNRRSLNELKSSAYKLNRMLKEIEIQAESQIAAGKDKLTASQEFDPLEFDRFTRLQELTRFMNETVADVQDTVGIMESFFKNQENAIVQQSILTNNILDSLMKVRLVPVDSISERLYKITRNTSKELNKRVELKLIGERTEMDRLVLDKVISPLEHLLRNCIAHGIELPEMRESRGKNAKGTVTMDTSLEGNFIVMKIKDDGAGINLSRVREIGLKRGMIRENVHYSTEELVDLIFQSGFSTADTISQVAGRGVGMDVVKSEITALGGSIDIQTQEGHGTLFTIVLPVAVATNQAMLTEAAGKLIAIPALLVTTVFSLKPEQMTQAYKTGQVSLRNSEKKYPLYYLGHMMGLLPVSQIPEIKNNNRLILISYLDQEIVIHVDKLHTTTEILIKSLGSYFGKISGLLGATLLGDGRQGVVVNPVMLKNHFEKNMRPVITNALETLPEQSKMKETITIMVVDDSVTVRRATTKILERYAYNIVTAKDGEDALEQLQLVIPDLILSDIEMPRMDGFEFVRNVRNTEKYKEIPIIMITSRTADKHKNFAFSLGANDFLGKPFQEDELIFKIKTLTNTLES